MKPAAGNYTVRIPDGKHTVSASAVVMSDSICVLLTGGEKPHAGCAVLSVTYGDSVKTDFVAAPGHRDQDVACSLCEKICVKTGMTVSMTAGLHIDNASGQDIKHLSENAEKAADVLIQKLLSGGPDEF